VRRRRLAAFRRHPRADVGGSLPAPPVGSVVARAGGVCGLRSPAVALALSRTTAGESSATQTRAGFTLAREWKTSGTIGTMVHAHSGRIRARAVIGRTPSRGARRLLVVALDTALEPAAKGPTTSGRGTRHGSCSKRDPALVMG